MSRANSTQSLRIRSLENDVAQLQAENVSLREQIIRLHQETEQNNQSASERVDSCKDKIRIKLLEVEHILQELNIPRGASKRQDHYRRRPDTSKSPRISPKLRRWRLEHGQGDGLTDHEGRLPPILEDKSFPRQTLESVLCKMIYKNSADCLNSSEDIQRVILEQANATDSPELGPPPVAHFEVPEAVTYSATENEDALPGSDLMVDLGTRRRRRESSYQREGKDNSRPKVESSAENLAISVTGMAGEQPLKSGAKRKLNMRDDDEHDTSRVSEKHEFQFSRKKNEHTNERPRASKESPAATESKLERPELIDPRVEELVPSRKGTTRDKFQSSNEGLAGRRKALGPSKCDTILFDARDSPQP